MELAMAIYIYSYLYLLVTKCQITWLVKPQA